MAFALGQGMRQEGFRELYDTCKRLGGDVGDFGIQYELRTRLRKIGEHVAETAPTFVTHKGRAHASVSKDRHTKGRWVDNPRLEDSVRLSVTRAGVSVYSTALHGGVQNVGGKVGRKHRTLLKRGEVSGWMNKAVGAARPKTQQELDDLVAWIAREFETG